MSRLEDPGDKPISGHNVRALLDAQAAVHDGVVATMQGEIVRLSDQLAGAVEALRLIAAVDMAGSDGHRAMELGRARGIAANALARLGGQ
jgi:hypothetical protein